MNTIHVFIDITSLKKVENSSFLHNICKTTNLLCILVGFTWGQLEVNMLKYVIHLTVYIYNTWKKELCQAEICFCCQHFAQKDALHQNLYTHYKLIMTRILFLLSTISHVRLRLGRLQLHKFVKRWPYAWNKCNFQYFLQD